jgi:catechol 2,3-dioxygenase-like lactoylglutathione lyase family enzyme
MSADGARVHSYGCYRLERHISFVSAATLERYRMATIDHIIVPVNDLEASVTFYTQVLGFALEGKDGPFTLIQVDDDFQLLLHPRHTDGFEHYAFAMSRAEFDSVFTRIKATGIAYGPSFDSVGSNAGMGEERGARGLAPTIYFSDPNNHLLEIRTYEH